jgi:hypothetical protein
VGYSGALLGYPCRRRIGQYGGSSPVDSAEIVHPPSPSFGAGKRRCRLPVLADAGAAEPHSSDALTAYRECFGCTG